MNKKLSKDWTLYGVDQNKGFKCLVDSSKPLKVNILEELENKYLDTIFKLKTDEQMHSTILNNSGLISIQRCKRTLS